MIFGSRLYYTLKQGPWKRFEMKCICPNAILEQNNQRKFVFRTETFSDQRLELSLGRMIAGVLYHASVWSYVDFMRIGQQCWVNWFTYTPNAWNRLKMTLKLIKHDRMCLRDSKYDLYSNHPQPSSIFFVQNNYIELFLLWFTKKLLILHKKQ